MSNPNYTPEKLAELQSNLEKDVSDVWPVAGLDPAFPSGSDKGVMVWVNGPPPEGWLSDEEVDEAKAKLRDLMAGVGQAKPLIPLGNRVLVRRDDPARKIGSFWIPDADQTEGQFGTVLALGIGYEVPRDKKGNYFPNRAGKPVRFDVKVGDRVVLYPHGGTRVKSNAISTGEELTVLVDAQDILGLVEETKE
jgi:co-chaperonin GroES (HSP10)